MKTKNIFITGSINVGKSTILNEVIDKLSHLKVGGFRTLPIYENNKRQGFILESLNGITKCFAHVDMKTNAQFDVYKFDYNVFEDLGVLTLESALTESDIIIMDEIGIMEKQATKFRQMIIKCFDAPQFVLGSFQKRATWFSNILKSRDDTKIFNINQNNRNRIPDQILNLIIFGTI